VRSAPRYQGTPWPGFTPQTVIVINAPTTVINTFVLVDVDTGQQFGRPVGTAGDTDGPAPTTTEPPTTQPTETTNPFESTVPETTTAPPPATLNDVVGTYTNLQITTSGSNCGTVSGNGETFQVTVADPSTGVVTITDSSGSYTGKLNPDYSFSFSSPGTSALLTGRFSQQGGTVTISGGISDSGCTLNFSANKS
jgi:hypothetical protein